MYSGDLAGTPKIAVFVRMAVLLPAVSWVPRGRET